MSVGQRIKECRIKMGITVDELAAKLKKNRATVYRYEKGDIENLPITILEPIANALNTSPAFLMGWTENSSPFTQRESMPANTQELFVPTKQELELLMAYRNQPNMQAAVNRLLGISHMHHVEGKVAARGFQEKEIRKDTEKTFDEIKEILDDAAEDIEY